MGHARSHPGHTAAALRRIDAHRESYETRAQRRPRQAWIGGTITETDHLIGAKPVKVLRV